MRPFAPIAGKTVNIATSSSSGNVQVGDGTNHQVEVINSGTNIAFFQFGPDNTVAATATTSQPIMGGARVVVSTNSRWVAAIAPTGTPKLYFTPGDGGI
jgi:hypothetical protein